MGGGNAGEVRRCSLRSGSVPLVRRLAVVAVVWLGLVAGLLAVAIANRPDHNRVFIPGAGTSSLDRLIGGRYEDRPASLLDGWSSTYTLVLILGTIGLLVAITCILLVYRDRASSQ